MILSLNQYYQKSNVTCLAASALMVLNYYSPERFLLEESNERKIFDNIKFSKYVEYGGGCYTKLAWYALNNKFKVNMVLGGVPTMGGMNPEVYGYLINEWLQYFNYSLKKKNFRVILNRSDPVELLEELLNEYKAPIIFYSHLDWHNSVFIGKDDNSYLVLDPIKGKLKLQKKVFRRKLNSPWGVNALQIYLG